MDNLRRHLARFVLGACCLLAPAAAQAAPDAEKPSLQILPLADLKDLGPLFYVRSEKDTELLDLIALRRSAPLIVKKPGAPIVIAVQHTDPETGAQVYRPVAQADWPTGGTRQALLFIEPLAEGRLRAVAMDNSLKTFPSRTLRAVNFSGETLAGKYSTFQGPIPPGIQTPVTFPDNRSQSGSIARFQVGVARHNAAGEPELVFNGWTDAWPQARTLLVIQKLHAAGSDRIQVNTIVEPLPEPAVK